MLNSIITMTFPFLFRQQKPSKSLSDFSSKERKQMIREAVRESNKMQADLVRKYDALIKAQ